MNKIENIAEEKIEVIKGFWLWKGNSNFVSLYQISYSTTWWKCSAYSCQGYFLCGHSADLNSTLCPLCPQCPFVPQYFPGGQLTACTGVCSCFSLCTGLCISLCWTSQGCCQPTFQPGQVHLDSSITLLNISLSSLF